VTGSFPSEVAPPERAQLLVDQGQEVAEGRSVAADQAIECLGNLSGLTHGDTTPVPATREGSDAAQAYRLTSEESRPASHPWFLTTDHPRRRFVAP
jgi:hypothetical protein